MISILFLYETDEISIATVNQNFKLVTDSVEAVSLLNGNVKFDTQCDGTIDIQHFRNTMQQREKNITLTTTNGGKTIISDLDFTDRDGIVIENVHYIGSAKILQSSKSYSITVDSVPTVDESDTTTSSDAGGIFLATK